MIIYWNGGASELTVDVNDESVRYRKIMGDSQIMLKFSLSTYQEFVLGAYVTFEAETYTLYEPQSFKKINDKNFYYTLKFSSVQNLMSNYKIKDTSGRLKFPFTAKPQEHLQLIVDNMNVNDSGWTVGSYITGVEKLISHNHANCLEALVSLAQEFDTEWEIIGKEISLHKVEYFKSSPLALSYGQGNGFVSGLGRQNESKKTGFNVLYVQGGERNIDLSVYGSRYLLLPKNQEYLIDNINFQTDGTGLSITIEGESLANRKEESLDSSHIYPKRTGTVSAVIEVDVPNNLYDFEDSSIPADLDFSANLMDGENLTVIFESGMLSGREFDVTYQHATRRFLIVPQEYDGVAMPEPAFKPVVGDKYAVFNMMLPLSYVSDDATQTGASWEMFKEASKFFYENKDTKFTFKGTLDAIWAKTDWVNIGGKIVVGGYVLFSDTVFQPTGILIRIVGIKDSINNPHSPIIELANSIQGPNIISELGQHTDDNEIVSGYIQNNGLQYTRRRFRDAIETMALLEQALLTEFSASINPLTIQTMAILVGDPSLQYRFVDGGLNEILHLVEYNQGTKKLDAEAGKLQHLTLDIDALMPNPTYRTWDLPIYSSAVLDDGSIAYYVYAKCSKTVATGVFLLSTVAIALEEVGGYFHFLVGILNTEFEGERSFVKMYGFTEILPGQIKVDKITSGDGTQVIELLSDRILINGEVTFSNNSPAIQQTIDNIILGARNLVTDSQILQGLFSQVAPYVGTRTEVVDTEARSGIHLKFECTTAGNGFHTQLFPKTGFEYRIGRTYTFSFWAKFTSNFTSGTMGCESGGTTNFDLTTSWAKYTHTWVFSDETLQSFVWYVTFLIGEILWVRDFKIEEGNIATDWTPAPEDVEDYTDQEVTAVTDRMNWLSQTLIDGNMMATGILAVGNPSGANAFISGLGAGLDAIRFLAGSDWANRATAPFRVLDDGSLFASKGLIAGWSITDSELSKNDIHINADRPAIEIYSPTTGELAVDISGASELSSLIGSSLTPSATIITASSNGSEFVPTSNHGIALQSPLMLVYGTGVTFSGTADDVITITLDLFQDIGTPYYESIRGGSPVTDYYNENCKIGIEIELPDTSKIKVYKALVGDYDSRLDGDATYELKKSLTLVTGTYTIRTYIEASFFEVKWLDGFSGTVELKWRTPQLKNLVISIDANKVEIIPGGAQIVKSSTQYFRADKNAADSSDTTPFLSSGGYFTHTGVFTEVSDERQKSDIVPLNIDLELFKNLGTYKYKQQLNPKSDELKTKPEDIKTIDSLGLFAQELKLILPEAVYHNQENDVMSIQFSAVTAMMVNVMKQVLEKLEIAEAEIVELKKPK